MKQGIHPKFQNATFTDISSGKKFIIGSTIEGISVEISSASHPFYTGEERIIDTENRVDTFTRKLASATKLKDKVVKKKAKKITRANQKSDKVKIGKEVTLKDMLKGLK